MLTYVLTTMCLVAYVATTVTGSALLAVLVWPVAIVLSVIAIARIRRLMQGHRR